MKKKNVCLLRILKWYLPTVLPPKSFTWGDLLSIPTSNYYSVFLLNSVNHDEGSMPIKNNSHLMNKLHPTVQWPTLLQTTRPPWELFREFPDQTQDDLQCSRNKSIFKLPHKSRLDAFCSPRILITGPSAQWKCEGRQKHRTCAWK